MQNILQKFIPYFVKFSNFKVVRTLKTGFIRTVPLTLIGSVFLLLAALPIESFQVFMTTTFGETWNAPLYQVVAGTFDILAIFVSFCLAYEYCADEQIDGVSAGMFGIAGLMIMTQALKLDGQSLLPTVWLGGQGLIAAVLCGLLSGAIYTFFIKKDIRIKLPDSVPPAVANSFSALIPGLVILTLFMSIHILVNATTGYYVTEAIYRWLQIPLQNLTDTLPGIIVVAVLISIFWWCGIHGDAIIISILTPITTSNMLANQKIVESGQALVVGENARIITEQFLLFLKAGGAGATIGLILAMIVFAKSKQMKELGKLAIGPCMFNINEPLIFGTPIIYNPIMFVPFVLAPALCATIAYFAISSGLVPAFGGATVPWTMPTILSGFITGGWKMALLQVVLVLVSFGLYVPFFKVQDNLILQQENEYESQEGK